MDGRDLLALRTATGLTGPALAKRLGISRNSLAKYEKARSVPIPLIVELALAGLGMVRHSGPISIDWPATVIPDQQLRKKVGGYSDTDQVVALIDTRRVGYKEPRAEIHNTKERGIEK